MDHVLCLNCNKLIGCKCDQEPRGSRMPSHLPTVDPLFYDAAFRPFTPAEKKLVAEKGLVDRARKAGL